MAIRRLVFGSMRRVGLLTVLLVAAVVGAYSLGVVGAPAVTGVENRFGPVSENETTIYTDLVVENPNPVGVELGGTAIDYTVSMNDVTLAQGEKRGVDVRPGANRVPFTTRMDNERIPEWWVTHIRDDETTEVRVDATVHSSMLDRSFALPQERTIETDLIGAFRSTEDRPVNADKPFVSDPVLVVRETDARWGTVTNETTPIEMTFVVYNPKAVSYAITEIGYTVTMNNVTVGNGTTEDPAVLAAKSETTVRASTVVRNDRLDEWWVSHLQRNETTDLRIEFHATARLGGRTVRLPLDALTYTRTVETDIFGTKNATDGPDGTGSDTRTGESTPTAATPTPSTTSTPSPTPTTAPTPTSTPVRTTDDGGLLGGGTDTGNGTDDGGIVGAVLG